MPGAGVRFPCFCVALQRLGLIVDGIDYNGEQRQITSQTGTKSSLQDPKIIAEADTIVGKRTPGVNECKRDDLGPELIEGYRMILLIGQSEIRYQIPSFQNIGVSLSVSGCFVEKLQPSRLCRI